MTVESAEELANVGMMKIDPQHLASTKSLGAHLQARWEANDDKYSELEVEWLTRPLPDLAPKTTGGSSSGEEGLAQFRRASLQLGRSVRHLIMQNVLLMVGVYVIPAAI